MKSLINLYTCLLDDLGRLCSVDPARDLVTLKSRAEHEGISFFTITLPEFASSFETCLEHSRVVPTAFVGWRKTGCLPSFLRGFTELVFDQAGRIRNDEISITAVYAVRQICRFAKKVNMSCAPKRERKAFLRFRDLEHSLRNDPLPRTTERYRHFVDTCSVVWGEVLGREYNTFTSVPRHGPGATAEMISGNQKFHFKTWPKRLERSFPFTEFGMSSLNSLDDPENELEKVRFLDVHDELPVRVIGVPKTSKTPRIIAIEPVAMQYAQQSIARELMRRLEENPLTRHSIRFTDQSVNQHFAISSSLDRSHSTIDLSDASDRVFASGVYDMLKCNPDLLRAIFHCRTKRANVPGVGIVPLYKFASMGSALCFPIESMYFYSILVHSLLWSRGLPPTRSAILKWARRIHIYGDDIIVPADETDTVLDGLAFFKCKVNTSKSFRSGQFRESCGADAFRGVDVTPVYLRRMRPSSRRDSAGILSWVATSNLLHKFGCWRTAQCMKNHIESMLGKLPIIGAESPGIGWTSFLGCPPSGVWCIHHHKPIVYTYKIRVKREADVLDGYPALLKFFVTNHSLKRPVTSREHLASSVRHGAVSRKRQWVAQT